MMSQPNHPYIAWEYKEIPADSKDTSLLLDCYECFGWQQDENRLPRPGRRPAALSLKPDRRLVNQMELTPLRAPPSWRGRCLPSPPTRPGIC